MRLRDLEICEATLTPRNDIVDIVLDAVDQASDDYQEYLRDNNDQDDIEYLAELIEEHLDGQIDLEVYVNHTPRKDPNEWLSAEAGVQDNVEFINIILHADNLNGRWGPSTFRKIMKSALEHETIHLNQFSKIGHDKLAGMKSGHQKGTEKMKSVPDNKKQEVWQREYLKDPHEIMAYAHDMARELEDSDNPLQLLRSMEQHRDKSTVYSKYRSLFDKDDAVIKQLLKYTSQYLSK